MEIQYFSTTRLAKERGVQLGHLFTILVEMNLIIRTENDSDWELTTIGKEKGGRICVNPDFRDYIEWPSDLEITQNAISPKPLKEMSDKQKKYVGTEGGEVYNGDSR